MFAPSPITSIENPRVSLGSGDKKPLLLSLPDFKTILEYGKEFALTVALDM